MDAVSNKAAFLNYLSVLALEDSYSSDEAIANATMPRIAANPRNNAGNNSQAGHPLDVEHFNFHSAIPVENELSSDETIAKDNTSGLNNQPAVSTSPSRQTNPSYMPASSKTSKTNYCVIPPEDALASDEAIATCTILKSNNHQALSATPPRLTNRTSAPTATTILAMEPSIENDLIFSSIGKNQQRFEKLIFKNAADYANLSKTNVPLIANTINWHLQFSAQHTPGLDIAIDKRLIKRLLELGARVNTPDEKEQRNSALWMALQQSDTEVVKLLLEYGCDPNSSCALTTAAKKGALAHMQVLLQYGANPNLPQDGKYPLTEACLRGDLDMVKLLLQRGAKIHEPNAEMTALMSASVSGNADLCALLIHSGARDHEATPEQLACFSMHLAEKHFDSNIEKIMQDLTQVLQNIKKGISDYDMPLMLSLTASILDLSQSANENLNHPYQKLTKDFCFYYLLNSIYFSSKSAGKSEIQKLNDDFKKRLSDNTLLNDIAELFKVAKSRRDGYAFDWLFDFDASPEV